MRGVRGLTLAVHPARTSAPLPYGRRMSTDAPTHEHDPDGARLGGAEDAAVDDRAEALRSQGIMPDVASIREDDRARDDDDDA